MIKKDIVIIGAGPSGMSTALHLLKIDPNWRERLVIVDKGEFPKEKICGGGITKKCLNSLRYMGFVENSISHNKVKELKIQFGDKKKIIFSEKPHFIVTRRKEFDNWLYKKCLQHGIEVHQNVRVRNISNQNERLVLNTNSDEYITKVVVGADGGNSIVRREFQFTSILNLAYAYHAIVEQNYQIKNENSAKFDFTNLKNGLQGYIWEFPVDSNKLNIGIYHSAIWKNNHLINVKNLLKKKLDSLEYDEYSIRGYPIRLFHPNNTISRKRVILVGDAAGVDSLMGEGISFSIWYGKIASYSITSAFNTNEFSFNNYKKCLLKSCIGKELVRKLFIARMIYSLPFQKMITFLFPSTKFL